MRSLPTTAALVTTFAAGLALSGVPVPSVAQTFLVIDDLQIIPSVTVPANGNWQITETGSLDTGTFGSVRNVTVLGLLTNDGDLKVGFSSESSGLQVVGRLENYGFRFGLPARTQAAQGEVRGSLDNWGGELITGSYTDSRGVLAAPLTGATFASPSFGGFVVDAGGIVENRDFTSGPSGTSLCCFRSTWTNHSGDLGILGTVRNSGRFESVNAPTVAAFPPATSYLQTITIGQRFTGGGWFENQAGGEVALRSGTTLLNQALFTNAPSGTVTVDTGSVLEVAGEFGVYEQDFGGTTVVSGGILTARERGEVRNRGSITLADDGSLENHHYVLNDETGLVTVSPLARIVQGSGGAFENLGHLTIEGTLTGGGTLSSRGLLTVLADGTVDLTSEPEQEGSFTQADGTTVVDGLLRAGSVEFLAGSVGGSGVIEYTGSLTSAVTFGAGLTVQPGNSPGILTINGNLEAAGAIFDIEVAGLEPGLLFDQLVVNGDANLTGATVNFRFLDGFLPTPGDTFAWLAVSGFASGLDTLTVSFFSDAGAIGGFLLGDGSLYVDSVTPVPLPPAAWALGSAVLALGAAGRRRRRAAGAAQQRH